MTTDVEVKGSYLPTGLRTMSSLALNIVKHGMMTATTTSGTNGTGTLSTSLIGEDAGEVGRHEDDGSVDVSSGEGWRANRSNGRSYILGPAVNQDPGGNINKESGTIWLIDNTMAHHHTFLIVQSDLNDLRDSGYP